MIITHFTKAHYYDLIVNSGVITKEVRLNFYDGIPPFVWFTQDKISKTALPTMFQKDGNYVGFQFESDDIGAVRWTAQKRKYQFNKSKRQRCEVLDKTASSIFGDNPHDFWISENEVDLKHCIGTVGMTEERKAEILQDGATKTFDKIVSSLTTEEIMKEVA